MSQSKVVRYTFNYYDDKGVDYQNDKLKISKSKVYAGVSEAVSKNFKKEILVLIHNEDCKCKGCRKLRGEEIQGNPIVEEKFDVYKKIVAQMIAAGRGLL